MLDLCQTHVLCNQCLSGGIVLTYETVALGGKLARRSPYVLGVFWSQIQRIWVEEIRRSDSGQPRREEGYGCPQPDGV